MCLLTNKITSSFSQDLPPDVLYYFLSHSRSLLLWVLLINRVLNSWIANALMWVVNHVCVCHNSESEVCVCVIGDFKGTGAGLSTFRRVAKGPRGLSIVLIHSFIHWARVRVVHQRRSLVLSRVLFFAMPLVREPITFPLFPNTQPFSFPQEKSTRKIAWKSVKWNTNGKVRESAGAFSRA